MDAESISQSKNRITSRCSTTPALRAYVGQFLSRGFMGKRRAGGRWLLPWPVTARQRAAHGAWPTRSDHAH